jgi:hypothetical protein
MRAIGLLFTSTPHTLPLSSSSFSRTMACDLRDLSSFDFYVFLYVFSYVVWNMTKAPSINYVTLEGGGEGVETSVTDCYRGEGGGVVEPPVTLH